MEVRLDSKAVVECLKGKKDGNFRGWSLIWEIRKLLNSGWTTKILHMYREANKFADILANIGCDQEPHIIEYEHPPSAISHELISDVMGVSTPRLISL